MASLLGALRRSGPSADVFTCKCRRCNVSRWVRPCVHVQGVQCERMGSRWLTPQCKTKRAERQVSAADSWGACTLRHRPA